MSDNPPPAWALSDALHLAATRGISLADALHGHAGVFYVLRQEDVARALVDARRAAIEEAAQVARLTMENEVAERDIHIESNNEKGALTRARQAQTAEFIWRDIRTLLDQPPAKP